MLEFGTQPPLNYQWSPGEYGAWRAGSAALAVRRINARIPASDRSSASRSAHDADEMPVGTALQGFATIYGQPHLHKGRIESFARGCFDRSLVAGAPAVS